MDGFAIGIDIGGTKVECAMVDHRGEVLKKLKQPTDIEGGYPAVLMQVIELVRELTYDANGPLWGVGVGVAGQVDAETGAVLSAGNLRWKNVPLKADLKDVLSPLVFVTNDVRAATWGEWRYGAGEGTDHLVCIFVGTGIGGGIVCNGKMLNGFGNTAGEIGHSIIELNGPLCTCGNYGCLEAFAGGWAIAKKAQEIVKKDLKKGKYLLTLADGQFELITPYQVVKAFRNNDPVAIDIINDVSAALIAGVTGVANILNPQRVVLGGGIMEALPELLEMVSDGVKKASLQVATLPLEIVKSKLKGSAGVVGAASLVIYQKD